MGKTQRENAEREDAEGEDAEREDAGGEDAGGENAGGEDAERENAVRGETKVILGTLHGAEQAYGEKENRLSARRAESQPWERFGAFPLLLTSRRCVGQTRRYADRGGSSSRRSPSAGEKDWSESASRTPEPLHGSSSAAGASPALNRAVVVSPSQLREKASTWPSARR